MDSKYIRKEITLAVKLDKPVLAIYLEETELKRGLELQLVDIQHIAKYREFSEKYFQELFEALPEELKEPT